MNPTITGGGIVLLTGATLGSKLGFVEMPSADKVYFRTAGASTTTIIDVTCDQFTNGGRRIQFQTKFKMLQ